VAQLVAQATCNRQVVGSSPTTGSTSSSATRRSARWRNEWQRASAPAKAWSSP